MFCSCAPFVCGSKSIVVVGVLKAYIGEPHGLTRRVNGFGGWNMLDYGLRTTDNGLFEGDEQKRLRTADFRRQTLAVH